MSCDFLNYLMNFKNWRKRKNFQISLSIRKRIVWEDVILLIVIFFLEVVLFRGLVTPNDGVLMNGQFWFYCHYSVSFFWNKPFFKNCLVNFTITGCFFVVRLYFPVLWSLSIFSSVYFLRCRFCQYVFNHSLSKVIIIIMLIFS